jgi:predicted metal-dependent hydrolase
VADEKFERFVTVQVLRTCLREFIAKTPANFFNRAVQLEFKLNPIKRSSSGDFLALAQRAIPLILVRNRRARRYVLRLRPDGSARVTIPRGGSIAEARQFAERNVAWIERAFERLSASPSRPERWSVGTEVYFRGERIRIEPGVNGESGLIRLGSETIQIADPTADLRQPIGNHLWRLAAAELPPRVFAYASAHLLTVRRVMVRNQRSRWGSCSPQGTVSLNWRLIQAPPFVRDYLILHELMHLREMNHSRRFWRHVQRVCPNYETAERWLKQHASLLR